MDELKEWATYTKKIVNYYSITVKNIKVSWTITSLHNIVDEC